MQLYNIICNTYAVRVADGETKFRLETTTAKGCNSLSEVKQEMRNRYENYTNPVAWGKKWNLVSSRTFVVIVIVSLSLTCPFLRA